MNRTTVVEFVLLGLADSCCLEITLFLLLGIAYFPILLGNISVIGITLTSSFLQTPMYYFLRNFALLEITFTSTFLPSTLYSLLTEKKTTSLPGCFLQMLFFYCLAACGLLHMAVVSLDRSCHLSPLALPSHHEQQILPAAGPGLLGTEFSLVAPSHHYDHPVAILCPNVMNHLYCDHSLLLQLPCTVTGFIEGLMCITLIIILPGTLMVTAVSYGCVIVTILHMPSSAGRRKAFSTCSAHLAVVLVLYSTCIDRYIRPAQRRGQDSDKVLSLFFCVLAEMLNPYIYSLRNRQVKQAFKERILKFSASLRQR